MTPIVRRDGRGEARRAGRGDACWIDRGDGRRCFDVAIVGAGMAGMAAALFAAERGLSCVQVGSAGGLLFASGLLDLLAVHPVGDGTTWRDPFEALAALARDEPHHPLVRVDASRIRDAFGCVVAALDAAGLSYAPLAERNRRVLTSIGTMKTTFAAPRAMAAGADALESRTPCLLVDFRGLREFSARQIVAAQRERWPALRAARVDLPGCEGAAELYAAHVARSLETRDVRDRTIARVGPLLGDAHAVGFPAVLGLARSDAVHAAFENALGVPVFEIPTMPTSVPGLRLLGALESALAASGVRREPHATVRAIAFDDASETATIDLGSAPQSGARSGGGDQDNDGDDESGRERGRGGDGAGRDRDDEHRPARGDRYGERERGRDAERVVARAVVLATGRFGGRGLVAERDRVRETILDLPVEQPDSREAWHRREFHDPAGHAINRAGLRVDACWRPIAADGEPRWRRLYAVGSILAGQDWIRSKCGSGLAIATARAAIDACAEALGNGRFHHAAVRHGAPG